MKKSKKAFTIIAVIVVISLVIAYGVMYILYPNPTKQWTMTAWDWLNEPLPIVGVSTLMILIFAWQVFKNSSFGKKQLLELRRMHDDANKLVDSIKKEKDTQVAVLEAENQELRKELALYEKYFVELCSLIPNKKVKELGERINGKEAVNNETTTN